MSLPFADESAATVTVAICASLSTAASGDGNSGWRGSGGWARRGENEQQQAETEVNQKRDDSSDWDEQTREIDLRNQLLISDQTVTGG